MYSVELSLWKTKQDIAKLEKQIENVLQGLLNDDILEEGDLVHVAGPIKEPPKPAKIMNSGKFGGFLASKKKKLAELEPMDVDQGTVDRKTPKLSPFSLNNDRVFLVPWLDNWIFGAEFISSSQNDQKLPTVVVSLVNAKGNAANVTLRKRFSYRFNVEVVAAKVRDDSVNHFEVEGQGSFGRVQEVKPGERIFVSACFSYPLMLRGDNDLMALVSVLCDGKSQWSRSFKLSFRDSIVANDVALKNYGDLIHRANCQFVKTLTLKGMVVDDRLLLEDFFQTSLQLRKFEDGNSSGKTVCYYGDQLALFWGSRVYMERSEKVTDPPRLLLRTRTREQMRHLIKAISVWVSEQEESSSKEISVISEIYTTKGSMAAALQSEVRTLTHVLYLNTRSALPSTRYDLAQPPVASISSMPSKTRLRVQWLKVYVQDMDATDEMFML